MQAGRRNGLDGTECKQMNQNASLKVASSGEGDCAASQLHLYS